MSAQSALDRPDDAIYRELTRLNNELVTAQRELSRRNAELKALTVELETRVAERTRHLERSKEELESLAYAITHDLRAPSRHVEGLACLLAQEAATLPGRQRAWVEMMRDASSRQTALIEDVLQYMRLASVSLHRQPIDMAAQVALLVAEIGRASSGPRIEWVIGDLPPASGDPELVRVILRNLLGNAAKFSSRRRDPRIAIDAPVDGGRVFYRIVDNGVGFDPARATKMFRPFERFHGDDYPGLGMGLAVVKRLVTRHDGRVWCDSRPGEGATFAFCLGGA